MDMDSPFAALMMPGSVDWELSNTLSILAMWSIMMAAMMLPSAWPMIRTFALVSARNREPARIEFKRLPGDF